MGGHMNTDNQLIETLLQAWRIKDTQRTGWHLREVRDPESVAAHSWGTAMLCRIHAREAGVHPADAMAMALLHDLAESETGDLPYAAAYAAAGHRSQKARAEAAAMERLVGRQSQLPEAAELHALWNEYEHARTHTAVFVRDMNLVDMALQALLYHREERTQDSRVKMQEFVDSARERVRTDVGKRLTQAIDRAMQDSPNHETS